MKLWVLSDIHADVSPYAPPVEIPECDVLVIAGDMREKLRKGVELIGRLFPVDLPIVYVAGNHDFYRCAIDHEREKLTNVATNICVLQDDHIDIGGVRFIGATLWTDYLLDGEAWRVASMQFAEKGMNDHRLIRVERDGYSRFSPRHAAAEHERSRHYIDGMLNEPFNGRKVVVTHHAPTARSIAPQFSKSLLNPAYASDLSEIVSRADLWVHGHVHCRFDYRVGDCRVICNPRGYTSMGEKTGFDPAFVVEV